MGPDGAMYIADWYNPIIQHGEVDFRDPRRDHTHGRIWRVTAKGRPLVERPKLVDASDDALLDALRAGGFHAIARQAAIEKPWQVHIAQARRLAAAARSGRSALEHHRLEALWTYQSLDVPQPQLLGELLRSHDHRVAAATRVLAQWRAQVGQTAALLSALVDDEHPQVRLEAVRARWPRCAPPRRPSLPSTL